MHDRNSSAGESLLVSRSAAYGNVRSALRLYVGRGRRYSVKQLSNATGVKDRVIECAMCDVEDGDFRPIPLEALLSIAGFLGPDFTTELLAPAMQGAYWLPDADDLPPGALAADSAEDTARLARMAADGKFDEPEKPDLKVIGRRAMIRGATLMARAA